MRLDDEFDGVLVGSKKTDVRHAGSTRGPVCLQMLMLVPTIVFGRCEVGGYSRWLESGVLGRVFPLVAGALFLSLICFPIAVLVLYQYEAPRERLAWAAAPLSIMLSYVQFLALLPLFQ